MSKKITIQYYGMTGAGKTIKEATLDASRKIESALEGDYTAHMIRAEEFTAILYRDPLAGWRYAVITPTRDNVTGKDYHLWGNGGYSNYSDCERHCRLHLAQNLIDLDCRRYGLEVLTDEADKRQHIDYCEWQWRYRAWHDLGHSDTESHRLASERKVPEGFSIPEIA